MNKDQISLLRYNVSGFLASILHLLGLIGIPITAYVFHNWWFLFGIPIYYIGYSIGWRTYFIPVIILAVIGIIANNYNLFNKPVAFYFVCFGVGFLGIRLYRAIGLGDKTSRALIALKNPDVKKEIEKEVEEGMKEYFSQKEKRK